MANCLTCGNEIRFHWTTRVWRDENGYVGCRKTMFQENSYGLPHTPDVARAVIELLEIVGYQ